VAAIAARENAMRFASSAVPSQEEYRSQTVAWAMSVFKVKGITVEWDDSAKVWDIETGSGWKTCRNASELAALAKDVQRGDA
jgi:hypothetical protein